MDHRSLSNLLIRLAGVIIIISSVLAIPHTVVSLATTGSPGDSLTSAIIMAGVSTLLPALIGLGLLWFPGTVTNRVICEAKGDTSITTDPVNLQQLVFSALGMYFFASSLFDAVYWLSRLKLYYAALDVLPSFQKAPFILPDDFAGMMSTATEFIVGIYLLFGSKGISNLVAKLRG